MGLESGATFPSLLNAAWPLPSDTRRDGDDHIREIKTCLQNVTQLISGVNASKSIFEYLFPIGAMYTGVPNSAGNPSDDIGGTWEYAGKIAFDSTGHGTGVAAFTELWTWQRIA